ncbi:MAG: hypothetical protein ACRBB6_13975 [Neptuniibacter sp.]
MSDLRSEMVLEIVELEEGELAIRNPDSSASEPMIKVNFSEEIKEKLNDQYLDVARVMLTAGIQMMADTGLDLSDTEVQAEPEPIIH